MKRKVLVALLCWTLIGSGPAAAGENPSFTLPLHIAASTYQPCNGYLPIDCTSNHPTVNLSGGGPVAVFIFVANYQRISYLQVGLEWDPSWSHSFGLFDCQPGQLEGFFPDSPTTASGVTAFSCVNGPALAVMGRMFFTAGSSGCLAFIQPPWPTWPNGIHAGDCQLGIDQITDEDSPRFGRVCVGSGGVDACDRVVPVFPSTWGAIKGSYR